MLDPVFALRVALMWFGASLFSCRGNDLRAALMCFDFGALKYRKDSQLCLLNQSPGPQNHRRLRALTEGPYFQVLLMALL